MIKGWAKHKHNYDRTMVMHGEVKVVLYDDRPESSTYRAVNEFFLGQYNLGLLVIPNNVFHAVQNVGRDDAVLCTSQSEPRSSACTTVGCTMTPSIH